MLVRKVEENTRNNTKIIKIVALGVGIEKCGRQKKWILFKNALWYSLTL